MAIPPLGQGYVASQPGSMFAGTNIPSNVNPAPGINWLDKYGEMDWGNALKTGDFGLTDAERASQLAGVIRFNNEEMAKAQAARAAEQAAISQPIQGPGRMPAQMMGGTYPYQIPNRNFTWQTTPQEQMALAGRMNRQDLQPLLGSGEYGPLAGQQYRYTPQGTTQINYGPGGGGYGVPPWQGLPPWQPPAPPVPPTIYDPPPTPPRPPVTIGDPPPRPPPETTSVDKPFIWDDVKNLTGPEFIDPKDWRGPEAGWGTTPGQQIGRAVVQPSGGIKFGGLTAGEQAAIDTATSNYRAGILSPLAGTAGYTGDVDDFSTMRDTAAQTQGAGRLSALEAQSRARAAQQQAVKDAEARRQQFTIRGLGEERGMAAANQAVANRQAQQQAAGAAQRIAEQQRFAQAEGQRQREAEMQRRVNQQQAQQQAAAVVRQTQQQSRGREAAQAKETQQKIRAQQERSAKRAQEASRKAAAKRTASRQAAADRSAKAAQAKRIEQQRKTREQAIQGQAAATKTMLQARARARNKEAEKKKAKRAAEAKKKGYRIGPSGRK